MKNSFYCLVVLFGVISTKAQDTYYKSTSNLIVANEKKGFLDLGLNYEFRNIQAQAVYLLSEKYFIFGTYNVNNSSYTYETLIFGDTREVENNNSGYSFGGGIQQLGRIGSHKNLELLVGYEYQKVNNSENFPDSTDKDYLNQNYYKIFTQFNVIKSKTNYDFGYSLKLSYLKLTHFLYNNSNFFENKSIFLLDPTLSFNYKFLTNKNLLLTSQIGVSAALNNLEYDGDTTYWISPILKFGVQYKFALK